MIIDKTLIIKKVNNNYISRDPNKIMKHRELQIIQVMIKGKILCKKFVLKCSALKHFHVPSKTYAVHTNQNKSR